MKIQIHASKISMDASVERHVSRRLHFALGRFANVVEKIDVTLADINGPKGGHDKQCRIRVRVKGVAKLVIAEVLHEELITATDLAVDRVGRAVARAVDRRNGIRVGRRRRAMSASARDGQYALA